MQTRSLLRRLPPWLAPAPLAVAAVVLASAAFYTPPLQDAATASPVEYARLSQPLSYLLAAPVFGLWDTLSLLTLTQPDYDETGARLGESTGFGDIPLSLAGVRVVAVLVEAAGDDEPNPLTKVSLRSKAGPDAVDVNAVAQKLGGGGHARASGAKLACGLDEARRRVLEAIG